ncbi:hypothetical protein [Defluviimonas salinarum]|uniref:Uncharacterized protein n=1 Tax=Defluviimonas salinarum TaxID=2992147 RepID=A0ABT3J3R1_9RHOB|nr:hypothetical protein [Defluviimonas salinarum]MCW3782110.1 hypothetical protein [Defluviimonas salinarum]
MGFWSAAFQFSTVHWSLAPNGTTEVRVFVGKSSATHVSIATAIWPQTMMALPANGTVELQVYFRAADGDFAGDPTSFWGTKID